jgi:Flp pilus assembly protein TadD
MRSLLTRNLIMFCLLLLILSLATPGSVAAKGKANYHDNIETSQDLLAMNPEMAKFLVQQIKFKQARKVRLNNLIDAIFNQDGLGISYGNSRTKTAVETFETKSGNCLSFTVLFVTMARHLGLKAYFQEVSEVMSWDQRGNLLVSNKHMYAEVELDNGATQVDFLPGARKRYKHVRRISDQRALAHFWNNVGAEKLTEENYDGAIADFHRALKADETLTPAIVNLAVVNRRLGDFEEAERGFLAALEIDKDEFSAASNLTSLYLARGREADAEPYRKRVENYLQQNPFHHFRLGMIKAEQGRTKDAIAHLKEAVRRMPGDPAFHISLAELYMEAKAPAKAQAEFTRALHLTRDSRDKEDLRNRLATLMAPH